ncbi:MAG: hypothetical protein Fues2KO_04560 [Fuerstiella sp.]
MGRDDEYREAPRHVVYERLIKLLAEAGFNSFVELYYANDGHRGSLWACNF